MNNDTFSGGISIEYIENGNIIRRTFLNDLDSVASFSKPSVGEFVYIEFTRKTYKAEEFSDRIKREKNERHKIDRPFSKEDKKPVGKGFLKRIGHAISESFKEENSYVKGHKIYKITRITSDTTGSVFKCDVEFSEEKILGKTQRPQ